MSQDLAIPSLDLKEFIEGTPQEKNEFSKKLGNAFEEFGFVAIKNHFLNDELVSKSYEVVKNFFDLDDTIKSKYEIDGIAGQRGYTGKGKEHAKDQNVGDLKEFYHIGQEISEDLMLQFGYQPNVFPSEIPDFKKYMVDIFRQCEKTAYYLLRAVALYLDLPEDHFEEKVKTGDSILRPIHYFPIENYEALDSGAVRAAAHTDIDLITLLMGASASGLEILDRKERWIPVTALPEQIVVNVGDMLDRLTNGKLKSTIHRVINPKGEELRKPRYSIPFFMHPKSDMDLSCLENCITKDDPKSYDDITAGEFLRERLQEIGLLKK